MPSLGENNMPGSGRLPLGAENGPSVNISRKQIFDSRTSQQPEWTWSGFFPRELQTRTQPSQHLALPALQYSTLRSPLAAHASCFYRSADPRTTVLSARKHTELSKFTPNDQHFTLWFTLVLNRTLLIQSLFSTFLLRWFPIQWTYSLHPWNEYNMLKL